jgi:hypothetical protein
VGYFNDGDLSTRIQFLQPLHDATDKRKHGGWLNVFEYCQSDYLVEALEQNDYLIIQIDTDCCEEKHYDVSRRKEDGDSVTPEELISKVIGKFDTLFASAHKEKYGLFKDRLFFAICVEEMECWLLPLYHDDKIKSSTSNCIHKLNPKLNEKFGIGIDKNNKPVTSYDKFSRQFTKKKTIDQVYGHNISLKIFLDSLSKLDLS